MCTVQVFRASVPGAPAPVLPLPPSPMVRIYGVHGTLCYAAIGTDTVSALTSIINYRYPAALYMYSRAEGSGWPGFFYPGARATAGAIPGC